MHKHHIIEQISQSTDQALISASNKLTLAGTSAAGVSGLSAWVMENQSLITLGCGVAGVLIGLLGFIGSMYFHHLKNKREAYYAAEKNAREEAIARMTMDLRFKEVVVEKNE